MARHDRLDLAGAGVVVTGAARGVGAATAAAFVDRGARVLLTDVDDALVAAVAADLGPAAAGCYHDVTSADSWRAALVEAAGHLGSVDVLVNNAGVMPLGSFVAEDDAVSRQTVEVDFWGVVLGMRQVLPGMLSRRRGHIVNVASLMADVPTPGAAVYGAAKVAVRSLSDAVRYEVAGSGVTVTAVLPTMVRTELTSGVPLGGGLPVTDPPQVAAAIVGSCQRRRALVYVPRSAAAVGKISVSLPRSVMDRVRSLIHHDRILHQLNEAERAGYDARLASHRRDVDDGEDTVDEG